MELQQEIVGILKRNGAKTVGLRFEQLPEEVIQKYQPTARSGRYVYFKWGQHNRISSQLLVVKVGLENQLCTVNLAMALITFREKSWDYRC